MASGVYARRNNEPIATDVTESESENGTNNGESDSLATYETENGITNGTSDPLATDVTENEKTNEEPAKCFANTDVWSIGDPTGGLPPPKKAKVSNDNGILE
jgi:hypothetical protein